MNARLNLAMDASGISLLQDTVWRSVQQLLASPTFAKAPRMCRLLSFLVEKKLTGMEHQISEYAIGLEVFRRDAHVYDTSLDPVVRVQVGRLRGRLAAYYKSLGAMPEVQISIPVGKYVPQVTQRTALSHALDQPLLLQMLPLRNLTCDGSSSAFVSGLEEELGCRLFQAFGNAVMLPDMAPAWPGASALRPGQRLEGSIRVEQGRVRACMRLVDAEAGHIAWLSQFDSRGELGMAMQEELATAICGQLQHYVGGRSGGMLPSWGSNDTSMPVRELR